MGNRPGDYSENLNLQIWHSVCSSKTSGWLEFSKSSLPAKPLAMQNEHWEWNF